MMQIYQVKKEKEKKKEGGVKWRMERKRKDGFAHLGEFYTPAKLSDTM